MTHMDRSMGGPWDHGWSIGYGTTELGYGTTNTDAGVGIGLKRGIENFIKKAIHLPIRPLISRRSY